MILLVASCERRGDLAEALRSNTSQQVDVATSLKKAASMLSSGQYTAVVCDETLINSDPFGAEAFVERFSTTLPIYVNLAVSGISRIVREVRVALRRYDTEQQVAMRAAEFSLRSDLRSAVTAILLSTDLAIHSDNPADAQQHLRTVYDSAEKIRQRLETAQ